MFRMNQAFDIDTIEKPLGIIRVLLLGVMTIAVVLNPVPWIYLP